MGRIRFLRKGEAEAFTRIVDGEDRMEQLIVELMLRHGLRLSEICGFNQDYWTLNATGVRLSKAQVRDVPLEERQFRRSNVPGISIEDFDFDRMEIHVLGKGRKSRIVPTFDRTLVLLRQCVGDSNYGRIFQGRRGYSRAAIQRRIAGYGKAAAIYRIGPSCSRRSGCRRTPPHGGRCRSLGPWEGSYSSVVSPHGLRHTFAITALRNGVNLRDLQMYLGHSSLTTTEVYLDFIEEEAADRFRKAMA